MTTEQIVLDDYRRLFSLDVAPGAAGRAGPAHPVDRDPLAIERAQRALAAEARRTG